MSAMNVRLTNVLVKFSHERNAELADLIVRLALRIEVRTTLATTHVEASKSILEDLLKTQELEDREIDCRVETETALVGAEGRVELHTVTPVDLALALVVLPDNAELDDALRDRGHLECLPVLGVLLEDGGGFEGGDELYGLMLAEKTSGRGPIGARVPREEKLLPYGPSKGSGTYPCGLAQTQAQTL